MRVENNSLSTGKNTLRGLGVALQLIMPTSQLILRGRRHYSKGFMKFYGHRLYQG